MPSSRPISGLAPVHLHAVDPAIVRHAVLFGRLFTERDHTQKFRSKIVISGGIARAINFNRVGEMASEKFRNLSLAIKHEHFDVVHSLLSNFGSAETHLFDTLNHHVFHDEQTCLAVPKGGHDAPALPPSFHQAWRSKIVVCRSVMLAHLERLAAVPETDRGRNAHFLVTMRAEGMLSDALLTMYAQHPGGRSTGTVTGAEPWAPSPVMQGGPCL